MKFKLSTQDSSNNTCVAAFEKLGCCQVEEKITRLRFVASESKGVATATARLTLPAGLKHCNLTTREPFIAGTAAAAIGPGCSEAGDRFSQPNASSTSLRLRLARIGWPGAVRGQPSRRDPAFAGGRGTRSSPGFCGRSRCAASPCARCAYRHLRDALDLGFHMGAVLLCGAERPIRPQSGRRETAPDRGSTGRGSRSHSAASSRAAARVATTFGPQVLQRGRMQRGGRGSMGPLLGHDALDRRNQHGVEVEVASAKRAHARRPARRVLRPGGRQPQRGQRRVRHPAWRCAAGPTDPRGAEAGSPGSASASAAAASVEQARLLGEQSLNSG